ncbi:ESPL1 protein, partial [Rhinopomastus cyanomelas]|nr:ESPL1 protein [Rhinopomastus cyanomelas]
DVLHLCTFTEGHCRLLHQLLQRVPSDGAKQKLLVKQLLYRNLQLFTSVAYDALQCPQVANWPGLEQLRASCGRYVEWMLEALEGLPESERTKYLDVTASCAFQLAYVFYSHKLHAEAASICELLCQGLRAADSFACPEIPLDRLHKCFRLCVESYRKLGRLERALACVVEWLLSLRGRVGELLAEPVALWVRVKGDAVKQGARELQLRTLKDALEGHGLDAETLVTVLFAELKAYKTVRGDTGQERYNVLCDLLEICSEESGRLHHRAVGLTELAQVLCYHSYAPHTDCSALDSVREALRLLELVPRSPQNRDRLLDDQAQALLWLYICTLESRLEKSTERDQRARAQGLRNPERFDTNDLHYEGRQLEDRFLYDGINFNLASESALSRSLDDAFALWKQLLATPGVPAVRSPEQTVASLQLLAALYKLMAKPFQAVESYLLLRALCRARGDTLGTASALCQLTRLLCQLECPSYAQLFLEETESCLLEADSSHESHLLLQQTCLLLRSQLCCVTRRVAEGLELLLELLQNPALQKIMKVWYLLRAHVLQLVALYLNLPPGHLSPKLRQRIFERGWKTPKTALVEAQKLFRSIILLLMGGDVLGWQTTASGGQFLDYGNNLLLKWHVLADALACSEQLVALLGRLEVVCKAKAFCLEALKLAMRLQTTRWCTSFLVLKAQLELQQDELELSRLDLQQALFLLESQTEFKVSQEQGGQRKVLPRKGRLKGRELPEAASEPPGEEESFLKGPALESVATVSEAEKPDALTASPELRPEKRTSLAFLGHPAACPCRLCSDLTLSALCLRWLLARGQAELAVGNVAEGLGLVWAVLPRCAAVATRFGTGLRDGLRQSSGPQEPPALGLLDNVVASGYAALALQSLVSPQLAEELEAGLAFLASCRPHVPGLGVSRATLLLAKAMATARRLAAERGGSTEGVFASARSWRLPALPPAEPKAAAVPQATRPARSEPQRRKAKVARAPAQPKSGAGKKGRGAKLPADDVFALGDLDAEAPSIVIRPAPCTPQRGLCALPARAGPGSRTPFTIFSESSPPAPRSRLLRAPRVLARVKSRLKVTFSDDSDLEEPAPGPAPAPACKASGARKPLSPHAPGARASPGGRSRAQPCRGRPGIRREGATGDKRVARGAPGKRVEEEQELPRAAEEELEMSFKVLRVAEEEEGAPVPPVWDPVEMAQEPLDLELGGELLAKRDTGHTGNVCPFSGGSSCTRALAPFSLPADPSLDTVLQLLKESFSCVSHCPPAGLYSHLCQLLALATGDRDPLLTAYLLSESGAITTRHQLLGVIHRKIHKEKKAAGDVAEQLRGLSLREGGTAPHSPHLPALENLFAFSPTGLGAGEQDGFRTQLQRIPSGVTVCLLTLASTQLGAVGDTLLVTRLEKGAAPLNIRIPTEQSKAPLRSLLSDFDSIQKEQKEATSCTDKQDWWLRRSELDRRMKNLIETLETQVLGCWRAALLPSGPDPLALAEDSASLCPQLRHCGWRHPDPALLKVLLSAAPFLTTGDAQALACSLCPAQPRQAQQLLEEALQKRRTSCTQPPGSLILVLDKHLHRLPWESMRCLAAVPVTRLPALRFLLGYNLLQKRGGSVLSRGVDPKSTFYVLNPHNNLVGTEDRFRGWFESEPGWTGVTGAVPSPRQMQAALLDHDLYIYAGHGAGARLLDGQTIARLDCRAVALLFGCSSAALAPRGALEPSGIVLKYLMAGW